MIQPIEIDDISSISLDHHGVIEASAGTGKTYCLEKLVLNIILQKKVPIHRILVVTFTEKATAELQGRIRKQLKSFRESTSSSFEQSIIDDALTSLDQAYITTIHGFCNRLIHYFTFDTGVDQEVQLCDDYEIYHRVLNEIECHEWPKHYGEHFKMLCQASDFFSESGYNVQEMNEFIVQIALRYRPECGDIMLPFQLKTENLSSFSLEVSKTFESFERLLSQYPNISGILERLSCHPSTKKVIDDLILTPLKKLMENFHINTFSWIDLFFYFRAIYEKYPEIGTTGFESWFSQKLGKSKDEEAFHHIKRIGNQLDSLVHNLKYQEIKSHLIVEGINLLKERVTQYKRKHNLISYDDMLTRIHQILCREDYPRSNFIAQELKKKFSYGLIDEFQDTDNLQWDIFRRIFLLPHSTSRLYLIGDPKQAIYGFRGADLCSYLRAKNEMLTQYQAILYQLPINWRSTSVLVQGYNKLFLSDAWFSKPIQSIPISYHPVKPVPESLSKYRRVSIGNHRKPIMVVDLNQENLSPARAREKMAMFIAFEIQNLVGGHEVYWYTSEGEKRYLQLKDIGILIRKSIEAPPIEEALIRLGIPYNYYKKEGVYESVESKILFYLFSAIANPFNSPKLSRALITPLFGYTPNDLLSIDLMHPLQPIKRLFERWYELAVQRKWKLLCEEIVIHSLLGWDQNWDDSRFSREVLIQILHDLPMVASQHNFSIFQLCELLWDYQLYRQFLPDYANLHQSTLEENRVQLMTLHVSKGLEFPVVFIAGGFTSDYSSSKCQIYHNEEGKRVFDLRPYLSEKEQIWVQEEELSEQLRLYYVGVTRAIFLVYLPYYTTSNSKYVGPVGNFLSLALNGCKNEPEFKVIAYNETIKGEESTSFTHLKEKKIVNRQDYPDLVQKMNLDSLIVSESPPWSRRGDWIESFSHLQRHFQKTLQSEDVTDLELELPPPYDDMEISVDEEDIQKDQNLLILPPGTVLGNIIHELFETIDFSQVAQASKPLDLLFENQSIAEQIANAALLFDASSSSSLIQQRKEALASILWNTLHQPLPPHNLKLCELAPESRSHEMEFCLYLNPILEPLINQIKDGYLVGFIDLVFFYNRRFYILDWKTNYLKEGYDSHTVAKYVDDHYRLQYVIYTLALQKWIQQIFPENKDPLSCLGGIYYLFVRGIESFPSSNGIFYHPLDTPDQLETMKEYLTTLVKVGV